MSAAEYPDSQTQDPADEDEFRALVGDDVEPLQAKGARYIPKPPELTPGILERRKAAQQEAAHQTVKRTLRAVQATWGVEKVGHRRRAQERARPRPARLRRVGREGAAHRRGHRGLRGPRAAG